MKFKDAFWVLKIRTGIGLLADPVGIGILAVGLTTHLLESGASAKNIQLQE